jgi:broad specificity phosphatase PhoE
VPVYLLRHAKAGNRQKWDGPDNLRPLSAKGREQAEALVEILGDKGVTRILSSAALRCVQSVEPLAARLGLAVEEHEALAEGATPQEVMRLLEDLGTDAVPLLCTHGDVIPTLIDALRRHDGLDVPAGYPCAKGSTWVLERDDDGRFVRGMYVEAP